jgi:imidazoleglycerol-phosphate dehydratase
LMQQIDTNEITKLDLNENMCMDTQLLASIVRIACSEVDPKQYPEPQAGLAVRALSKHLGLDQSMVYVGNGSVVEEVGIVLGEALLSTLGDKKGIKRFGFAYVTMDDSLSRAVVDLGGRPYYVADLNLQQNKIEDVMSEDIEHFLMSFALASKINVHVAVLYGKNDHHKIESTTKALALALREAASQDPRLDSVPSAKGVL